MSWKTSKWTWKSHGKKRHGNSIPKIRSHSAITQSGEVSGLTSHSRDEVCGRATTTMAATMME